MIDKKKTLLRLSREGGRGSLSRVERVRFHSHFCTLTVHRTQIPRSPLTFEEVSRDKSLNTR
jgi:hypothetical protein